MQSRMDSKQFVLSLTVLILLGALLAGSAWGIWKALTVLSPQTATAIVAGAVTILVSVFSVLWSKRAERLREIEQEHRKEKIPVYEQFLRLLFRVVMADKVGEEPVSEQELIKSLMGFAQKIIVWGSDDVLREYATFRKQAGSGGFQSVLAIEGILLAIRRDVGHKNKGLKPGDLLGIFINDIDSVLAPSVPTPSGDQNKA